MSDNEEKTNPEGAPRPSEPPGDPVLSKLEIIYSALVTLSDDVLQMRTRLFEVTDDHGSRIKNLERAQELRTNGHAE